MAQKKDPASQKPGPQVRLFVEGAFCPACAAELSKQLAASGVKFPSKIPPNRGRGHVIVLGGFPHDGDLGKLAKSINGALTPHREQSPPGVSLELRAKLTKPAAAAAMKTLKEIKGVDAAKSKADAQTGVISVRLSGDAKTSVNGIIGQLKTAGIAARVVTGK